MPIITSSVNVPISSDIKDPREALPLAISILREKAVPSEDTEIKLHLTVSSNQTAVLTAAKNLPGEAKGFYFMTGNKKTNARWNNFSPDTFFR